MRLDAKGCIVEYRGVDDEKLPDSPVRQIARFAVEDGRAGVQIESAG